jgi:hypothetical protein
MNQVLGPWISTCYSLLSVGACFVTHKPFISLLFQFWGGPTVNRGYWISGYAGTTVFTALQNHVCCQHRCSDLIYRCKSVNSNSFQTWKPSSALWQCNTKGHAKLNKALGDCTLQLWTDARWVHTFKCGRINWTKSIHMTFSGHNWTVHKWWDVLDCEGLVKDTRISGSTALRILQQTEKYALTTAISYTLIQS